MTDEQTNRPPDYKDGKHCGILIYYDACLQGQVITLTEGLGLGLEVTQRLEIIRDGEATIPEFVEIMGKLISWGRGFREEYPLGDEKTMTITKYRLQETPTVLSLIQKIGTIRQADRMKQLTQLGGSMVAQRLGVDETDERIRDLCMWTRIND